jgi:hypothetical protein
MLNVKTHKKVEKRRKGAEEKRGGRVGPLFSFSPFPLCRSRENARGVGTLAIIAL